MWIWKRESRFYVHLAALSSIIRDYKYCLVYSRREASLYTQWHIDLKLSIIFLYLFRCLAYSQRQVSLHIQWHVNLEMKVTSLCLFSHLTFWYKRHRKLLIIQSKTFDFTHNDGWIWKLESLFCVYLHTLSYFLL